jgi:hypothetical protein
MLPRCVSTSPNTPLASVLVRVPRGKPLSETRSEAAPSVRGAALAEASRNRSRGTGLGGAVGAGSLCGVAPAVGGVPV